MFNSFFLLKPACVIRVIINVEHNNGSFKQSYRPRKILRGQESPWKQSRSVRFSTVVTNSTKHSTTGKKTFFVI